MKRINEHELINEHSNEINEYKAERKEIVCKSDQKIKNESYVFFHNMSDKYWINKSREDDGEKERNFLAEIREMDVNIVQEHPTVYEIDIPDFSKEELQQIMEDDPGYVNGKVLDYDNEENSEKNTYKETGLHTGAIRWGDYATKESIEYITLDVGMRLGRYGNTDGTFLSDINAEFTSLELPLVKEKYSYDIYEVIKPFPAERSKVAKQPWNDTLTKGKNDITDERTIQYKMPIPVSELVKGGYLKTLE